jgi:hypothetical protein
MVQEMTSQLLPAITTVLPNHTSTLPKQPIFHEDADKINSTTYEGSQAQDVVPLARGKF